MYAKTKTKQNKQTKKAKKIWETGLMFFTVYMTFSMTVSIVALNLAQLKKYPHLQFKLKHYILIYINSNNINLPR